MSLPDDQGVGAIHSHIYHSGLVSEATVIYTAHAREKYRVHRGQCFPVRGQKCAIDNQ